MSSRNNVPHNIAPTILRAAGKRAVWERETPALNRPHRDRREKIEIRCLNESTAGGSKWCDVTVVSTATIIVPPVRAQPAAAVFAVVVVTLTTGLRLNDQIMLLEADHGAWH